MKKLFLFITAMLLSVCVFAQDDNWTLMGDVNNDGSVSVTDVTMVIGHVLGLTPEGFNSDVADVNGDGSVTITDVTIMIDMILKHVNINDEPILLMSTSEIDFGVVEIGETKKIPLSVTNKGVFPEYIHTTCQGDFFIAPEDQYFMLESGQSLTIDISYTPTSEISSNGSLALTTSSMRGRSKNVILRGEGTEFDPQAHIFSEVITNSSDNAETLLCDTLNGKYAVNYAGEIPDIKEGNVVFVDNDSTTYIILVTNVTKDGNLVSFEGKRGDLSYVFHDISFTLSTAADDVLITRLNGKETSRRVKLSGSRRVRETKSLFDKKKNFDIPIVKMGDAKFSLEGSFHPSLDCEMYFEFYEPFNDVFEGYAFTKAGLFRSGVKFIGELKTECNLSVNVKKKSEKYEYDEKEPKLIKENFLPKKNWDFVVFGVPVRVSFGCDLFEKAYIYCKGDFEMYQGFVSTITGTYGFSYDPNDYFNGYVPIKDVDIQFDRTDPTVKGKLEAGLKAYLIPRFYARIYDLVGPCVELKPYFDLNLGGAFQEEFIDTSENGSDTDYISTYMNASFGVDWGLGFSVLDEIEFKKFADKTWDMGKTFIDPVYLLKSPSDLNLVSESTKKVRKGQPIDLTFDAQCKFLWGSYSSPFFPVIKIDIPKRKFHTYLFTYGNGKANYKWIPQTDDEELYAKIYDKDGKAVKTICLPNPEDNSMRAITDEASNVTACSAVLNGKFDSGKTVVIDKMGFCYSYASQVPKIDGENCTFVEVEFDDMMDKSCLVKDLNPGTTYYYRAYASNKYGSDYGNVLSFTTEGQISLQLSTTTLELTTGSQGSVDITSGSGSYDAVSNDKSVATVAVDGSKLIIKAVDAGTATITVKDNQTQESAKIEVTVTASETITPGTAIDLGLPSGTLWASCNVGATKPEDFGNYYAWGETEEKDYYYWDNYMCEDAECGTTKDPIYIWNGNKLYADIAGSKFDVATSKWGSSWHMPSSAQMDELLNECIWTWCDGDKTKYNGTNVKGYIISSKVNNNKIFLPAAGNYYKDRLIYENESCLYWSSSQYEGAAFEGEAYYTNSNSAIGMDYKNKTIYVDLRYYGQTIRPVISGSQQTEPEPYAVLSNNNTVLTFYYDNNKKAYPNAMSVGPYTVNGNINVDEREWANHILDIKSVVFDPSFANCETITSTEGWFSACQNIKTITGLEYLNTSNVTTMYGMFYNCASLTSLDVSHFDTRNVTNFISMFQNCSGLTSLDVSNFETSNATTIGAMFGHCYALESLDLSSFNTANVTDISYLFVYDRSLKVIYVGSGWTTENVKASTEMFWDNNVLVGGAGTKYSTTLVHDYTYAHVDGGKNNPGYFTFKRTPGIPDHQHGSNPDDGYGRPDTPGPDADDQGDL